jgi:hypothetical protein
MADARYTIWLPRLAVMREGVAGNTWACHTCLSWRAIADEDTSSRIRGRPRSLISDRFLISYQKTSDCFLISYEIKQRLTIVS